MQRAKQTSESIELAILLALSGGLMDAYSYLGRGGVFANAQTGNMLLLGVHIAQGEFERALTYLFPVVAFALGIALAQVLRLKLKPKKFHWRQFCLIIEIVLLGFVATLSSDMNLLANCLTSCACGIQVQTFRKLHGRGFATTMCIGNLRSGTDALVSYLHHRKHDQALAQQLLKSTCLYFGTIICFVMGAVLGAALLSPLELRAIAVSVILLAGACALLFVDREKA